MGHRTNRPCPQQHRGERYWKSGLQPQPQPQPNRLCMWSQGSKTVMVLACHWKDKRSLRVLAARSCVSMSQILTLHRRRSPAACLPGQEQVPGKSKPKCCCKYSVKKLRFRPHFSSLRGEGGFERHPPTKETATTTTSWKYTCIHYFRDLEKLMPKLSQRHTTTSTKNWEKAREEKTKFINAV